MSALAHICHQLGYSSRETAALAWINDMPILKHALEFIASDFIVLSKHEVSLLEEVPQSIRDLSEEALDQKIAALEEELLELQQQHSGLSDSIQSAVPYLNELASDIEQVPTPEGLPDLAPEVEGLQMKVRQNTLSILDMPDDLQAQLTAIRQSFDEDAKNKSSSQPLEAFIRKEDRFIQLISATAKEINLSIDSVQSDIERYSAECSVAIAYHRDSMNTVMNRKLNHLLCTSRLQKLSESLPLYAAGKLLPQFQTTLKEFLSVHNEYKDLLTSCSNLAKTVICCPEALSQQLVAEALLQRCSDVKGQALDIILEAASNANSRGQQGLEHAEDKNKTINAVMNASGELLESLSCLYNDHISSSVAAAELMAAAKKELVVSPTSALGYQAVVSALSKSTLRGAAQVADTLLFVLKGNRSYCKNSTVDLSEVLDLQDRSVSAIEKRLSGGQAQTAVLARLQQAIQEMQEILEHYSSTLGPWLHACN